MALPHQLATVGQGNVQGDDEMAVAGTVDRALGTLPPLDEPGKRHRGELALGVRLIEAGPQGRLLRRLGADRKCVKELEPPRIRESGLDAGRTVIGIVVRALE